MSMTALGPRHIARHLYRYEHIHTPLPGPEQVTDEHVKLYHERGFLAVENVFTPAEIEAAKAGISWLIGGHAPAFANVNGAGMYFEDGIDMAGVAAGDREKYARKIMGFVDHDPRLKAMAENANLVRLAERLAGTAVNMIQDMALLKPAHVGREKPWHQDAAYFLQDPMDLVVGTWTALDAATPENGCMHVIPGSHRKGGRPHYHDRDCQLADEDVDVERDVVVPLKPGGALLFSGLLHHGTPPNLSGDRRRALQFHFASVNCRKMTRDEHGQLFHDSKGAASCSHPHVMRPISERAF